MIVVKEFPDKSFSTQEDAMKELILNKKLIIEKKKSAIKYADAFQYFGTIENENKEVVKSQTIKDLSSSNEIKVVAVSNACNYFDSHGDVSINSSWNRTAKNTKNGLHLQEHQMRFDKLISDNVVFTVENKTWKELGFDYEGSTECLVMYSKVEKETNPLMFNKYIQGKVKNHSSGLRYVSIEMAVNNNAEWAKEEKEVWDKFYPLIVNKEDVDSYGYFYAVTEQKIIENSAVLKGSNPATPTILVESADSTSTKDENTDDSTSQSEQKNYINPLIFM